MTENKGNGAAISDSEGERRKAEGDGTDAQRIYHVLEMEPGLCVDEIAVKLGMDIGEVKKLVVEMDRGLVLASGYRKMDMSAKKTIGEHLSSGCVFLRVYYPTQP